MAGYYDRDRRYRWPDGSDNFDNDHPAGSMNHPSPSHNNANEYIASGTPFVVTKQIENNATKYQLVTISFPYVTRWLMLNVFDGIIGGTPAPGTVEANVRVGFGNYDADEGILGLNGSAGT